MYETIVRTVRERRDYHETCYKHSKKLLELLKGESTLTSKKETIAFSGKDGSPESMKQWENFWYDENHLKQEVNRIGKEGGYEWTPGT